MNDFRYYSPEVGFSFVYRNASDSNPRKHFHTWWEILYIIDGERDFFVGNKTIHIIPGDFIVVPPGILHQGLNRKNTNCRLYNVFFDDGENNENYGLFVKEIEGILGAFETCISLNSENQKKLLQLFENLRIEYDEQQENYIYCVRGIMMQIVALVSRQKYHYQEIVKPLQHMNSNFVEIIKWINSNYVGEVSLEKTAAKFNISGEHLSRCFREYTQFSYVEYVNSLRVSRACYFLRNSNLTVLEIAMKCGFGSITQFGRWFKKLTGKSPLKYRKA